MNLDQARKREVRQFFTDFIDTWKVHHNLGSRGGGINPNFVNIFYQKIRFMVRILKNQNSDKNRKSGISAGSRPGPCWKPSTLRPESTASGE